MTLHEVRPHWLCRHDGQDVYCEVCRRQEETRRLVLNTGFEGCDDESD